MSLVNDGVIPSAYRHCYESLPGDVLAHDYLPDRDISDTETNEEDCAGDGYRDATLTGITTQLSTTEQISLLTAVTESSNSCQRLGKVSRTIKSSKMPAKIAKKY